MQLPKIDFKEEAAKHDIVSVAERLLGAGKKTGNRLTYLCPNHAENTPSLSINGAKQTWRCYGACQCGGDVFDLAQFVLFGSIAKGKIPMVEIDGQMRLDPASQQMKAYEFVTGQAVAIVKRVEAKPAEETPKKEPPSMNDVIIHHAGTRSKALATEYFSSRGLSGETYDAALLGCKIPTGKPYEWASEKYRDREIVWFHSCRHMVPWLSGGKVLCTKGRLDVSQCFEDWAMQDASLREAVMEDLYLHSLELAQQQLRYGQKRQPYASAAEIPTDEFIKQVYGPRYWLYGPPAALYGTNTLYQRNDKGEFVLNDSRPTPRRWQHLLITEGEINRLSALQAGFPAVSAKVDVAHKYNWKAVFAGVMFPIIIADPDESGQVFAQAMRDELGRGKIVTTPAGQDMNDLLKSGSLESWLWETQRIKPMPLNLKEVA